MKISLSEQLKKGAGEMRKVREGKKEFKTFRTYRLDAFEKQYDSKSIKRLRNKYGLSQKILSIGVGASVKTVQAWEGGNKSPSGTACRILDGIEKIPEFRKYLFPELQTTN